ncbi:MAG: ECF transporter S component [Theionarchaea archaeon]|nr:ECF transporter S component [Theionarchaea archaeon]MBU7000486.1 ECF transporter S component [Theionarchaea archaeon]MBU7019987.1 ECF transporter S component [Theionarchaea archaeon]MBU7035238.1 ECF transporter S component [Theionarchaea archaeon]MBU7040557.1 ECF transporter S component [Theionarchaea archaeon]
MDMEQLIPELTVIVAIVLLGVFLRIYVSRQKITVKHIVFVGIMSAMGTALAVVSFVPIGPNINVDFSHIGTFIVAIALGPFYGMVTGALIGIYPMTVFGNVLVPPGKALTGLFVGYLAMKLNVLGSNGTEKDNVRNRRIPRIVPTALAGWIPEAAFTLVTMGIVGIPYFLPMPVVEGILVKGAVEILLLGIVCEALFASKAIKHAISSFRS